MVCCAKFVSMQEALGMANGLVVDVFTVVASVGPLIPECSLDPLVTREICLKDSRLTFPIDEIYFANLF